MAAAPYAGGPGHQPRTHGTASFADFGIEGPVEHARIQDMRWCCESEQPRFRFSRGGRWLEPRCLALLRSRSRRGRLFASGSLS